MVAYRVLVADPPWSFTTWSDKAQKSAKRHYQTMTLAELARLPVQEAVASDAILLLWATWPNLMDAITVGSAWGFVYKTLGFIWIKTTEHGRLHTGLGYYTRANSEPCLLFTRGHVGRDWIKSRGVHQVITDDLDCLPGFGETLHAQIMGHSTKPEMFYERVEALVDGPYLELFGRRGRAGWTVLGDGVTGNPIDQDLRAMAEGLVAPSPA